VTELQESCRIRSVKLRRFGGDAPWPRNTKPTRRAGSAPSPSLYRAGITSGVLSLFSVHGHLRFSIRPKRVNDLPTTFWPSGCAHSTMIAFFGLPVPRIGFPSILSGKKCAERLLQSGADCFLIGRRDKINFRGCASSRSPFAITIPEAEQPG